MSIIPAATSPWNEYESIDTRKGLKASLLTGCAVIAAIVAAGAAATAAAPNAMFLKNFLRVVIDLSFILE
jgi:hypothetical protein